MIKNAIAIVCASLLTVPAMAQTVNLQSTAQTLSKKSGYAPATTEKDWWSQLNSLPNVPLRPMGIDPKDWIVPINEGPPTGAPDTVGAFRLTLNPTDFGYNDAVLYPGVKNGSPHGHSNYGVYGIDENTTSEGLLANWKGGYNALLGSAYWSPWLLRLKDGKIIRPDTINVYYKRYPIDSPYCTREALKGCIPMLPGIKMIAGYDMKRMGQAQPENTQYVFDHRCTTPGKPGTHYPLLDQAIQACGGYGTIATSITFPNCSNGQKDSPDHRSHLAYQSFGWWGYSKCPDTHPYLMPTLNQQINFTIEKDDGPVLYSSDVMPNMPAMPAGSTFHADWIYGIHPALAEGMDRCWNLLLSCSNGVLGNKTMLKMPSDFTFKANPRLIDPPKR